MQRDVILGGILMLVGTALFFPSFASQSGQLATWALVPAAVLLTYGTYPVGTTERGRAV
jgi:hypothetical protein